MANKKPLTKRRKAEMELKAKKEKQKRLTVMIVSIVLAVLAVGGIVGLIIALNYEEPPVQYEAQIQIKDKGTVTVKLNSEKASKAALKFVELAKKGSYDGKSFYELKDGQLFGGDKDADVGHLFAELDSGLSNKKGVISMVKSSGNTVNPMTFFINTKDNTQLDKEVVEFGEVIGGLDIIEGLTVTEEAKPVIEKITIIEK